MYTGMKSETHSLFKLAIPGYPAAYQCRKCGATYDKKLWWLTAYYSTEEPPCGPPLHTEWARNALQLDYGIDEDLDDNVEMDIMCEWDRT